MPTVLKTEVTNAGNNIWDWKGHEDYWPLDFHKDSLLS